MDALGYVDWNEVMMIANLWCSPMERGGLGAVPPARSKMSTAVGEGVSSRKVLSTLRQGASKNRYSVIAKKKPSEQCWQI